MHIFTGHTGHKDSVSSLASSIDGQLLGTRSLNGTIQVWDMPLGSLKCTLDGPGGELKWHPRLHEVLAGSEDGSVKQSVLVLMMHH
ncbi:hypothetical protein MKW98_007327 [Papaver atlanticum]|uniref:Uncharacterized protein n=1 Tax=Papaver atlanticum TaxID=357466 RepID=A0AAD4SB08_9MAGN|nr:hypothetical protein MKW98_007327 [Papaver atlanticum]